MKTLVIAEKPDQARSFYLPLLEKISGEKFERRGGYLESKSFYLSWFFGHLLEHLKPDEYDQKYKEWRLDDLPILPEKMVYKYKGESQKEQGQLILSLCQKSNEIICGTDPDREGQGIFDTFSRYYKLDKPIKRLWATSLTEKDLLKAWSNIKDMKEYRLLSAARELRADSDWLVGMNASRAYSIIGKGNLPIGRVLTATLAIIVKRDFEVENYKESCYYQLKGTWDAVEFTYFDESGSKFDDRKMLDTIKVACAARVFSLSDDKEELKTENPPKPFSLPELQKEANRKFGFSLDKTLSVAQSLYEKKLTTYPRTDSPFLPESDLPEYHALVRVVASPEEKKFLRVEHEKPVCVKNTDSPHTALIVTGENGEMSEDEKHIYNMIRSRFVAAFMVPRKFKQFDLEISDGAGIVFRATIRQTIDPGFRKLYIEEEKEDGVQEIDKSIVEKNLREKKEAIKQLSVTETKKTKPKYYTPATLITAMQTCGRYLEKEDSRKILSETKGIGTPATQAMYPPQLIHYEYIVDQRGCFVSTVKGRKLIGEISPDLKTPELTADWEMKLKMVEYGKLSPESYMKEMQEYIRKIIVDAKLRQGKIDLTTGEKTGLQCVQCGQELLRKGWGFGCSIKTCGFSVNSTILDREIPEKEIHQLLKTGESNVIKGFKKSSGGTFDAKLVLKEENGKKVVRFEFENTPCPKCKAGTIRVFEWGVACSDREKCSFKIGTVVAHKKVSDSQVKKLLISGKTDLIKGFKSREGRPFDARLKIDQEFKVVFDFGD